MLLLLYASLFCWHCFSPIRKKKSKTTHQANTRITMMLVSRVCLVAAFVAIAVAAHNCREHTSCGGCTQDPSGRCGWCAEYLTCEYGTASGPKDSGKCTGYETWKWYSSSCGAGPAP